MHVLAPLLLLLTQHILHATVSAGYTIHRSCLTRASPRSSQTKTQVLASTLHDAADYAEIISRLPDALHTLVLSGYFSNFRHQDPHVTRHDYSAVAEAVFDEASRDPSAKIQVRCIAEDDTDDECEHVPGYVFLRGADTIYVCPVFFDDDALPPRPVVAEDVRSAYRMDYCWDQDPLAPASSSSPSTVWRAQQSVARTRNKALALLGLILQTRAIEHAMAPWRDPSGREETGLWVYTKDRKGTLMLTGEDVTKTPTNVLSYVFAAEEATFRALCQDWMEYYQKGYTIKRERGVWKRIPPGRA